MEYPIGCSGCGRWVKALAVFNMALLRCSVGPWGNSGRLRGQQVHNCCCCVWTLLQQCQWRAAMQYLEREICALLVYALGQYTNFLKVV